VGHPPHTFTGARSIDFFKEQIADTREVVKLKPQTSQVRDRDAITFRRTLVATIE